MGKTQMMRAISRHIVFCMVFNIFFLSLLLDIFYWENRSSVTDFGLNNALIHSDSFGYYIEGTNNCDVCLYIAQRVSEKYGYNIDDLIAYDWTLDQPAIEGGFELDNETVGFRAVSVDGYFVAIGQSYVYDIWVDNVGVEQHVLLMDDPGTANYDLLQEFKGYAQAHNTAEESRNFKLGLAGGIGLLLLGVLFKGWRALSVPDTWVTANMLYITLAVMTSIVSIHLWLAWREHMIMETNQTYATLQLRQLAHSIENENILSVKISLREKAS